jgi:hypothetical protein
MPCAQPTRRYTTTTPSAHEKGKQNLLIASVCVLSVDSKYLHPSAQVTEDTYHDVCARLELQARVIGIGSETSSAVERHLAGKFQSCECDNEKAHENLAAALSLVAVAAADSRRR